MYAVSPSMPVTTYFFTTHSQLPNFGRTKLTCDFDFELHHIVPGLGCPGFAIARSGTTCFTGLSIMYAVRDRYHQSASKLFVSIIIDEFIAAA